MMQQKARKSRIIPTQRASLHVEALETRVLPAGPSGVVTAVLNPTNGVLTLQGDSGNNNVRIIPSPFGPGLIRVQGQAFTSINAVTFTDFTLSSITSITVNFALGNATSLTVTGFSIPGNLRITGGAGGADTFSISNFNSNQLILNAGASNDTVTVNAVRNGNTMITTSTGTDTITVGASNIGMAMINSSTGTGDQISVTGSTVGSLNVTQGNPSGFFGAAGANDVLNVVGNTLGRATLNVLSGRSGDNAIGATVNVNNNTLTSNAANSGGLPGGSVPIGGIPLSIPSTLILNVNANATTGLPLAPASVYRISVVNNTFSTGAPAVLYNGSLKVQVGDAENTSPAVTTVAASTLTVSQITGVNDATVMTGANFDNITLGSITARQLTSNNGNNTKNYTFQNTTVAGPTNVLFGSNAGEVTLNNILVSVTPIDLALGRAADLTLMLGNQANGTVTVSNLNIGRNLTVTNGNGDTMFNFFNDAVGQDFIFGATPGLNDTGMEMLMFTNVKVLNQLAVALSTGLKAVSAQNTMAAFGQMVANGGFTPNSNVFWDQGGNAGFFVDGFDNFLVGPP